MGFIQSCFQAENFTMQNTIYSPIHQFGITGAGG